MVDEKIQGLCVVYGDEITRCQVCHCVEESDGGMVKLDQCKHTHHIRCLVNYAAVNSMVCPECSLQYEDARVIIALGFMGASS